jgi:DNA-binding MarR family transcriptional regulator
VGKKAKERKRREREAIERAATQPPDEPKAASESKGARAPKTPRAPKAAALERTAAVEPSGAPATGELATRLNSVAIHLLRRLQREDSRLGLSGARLSALSVLVFGGPRTLGKLAHAEGVSPPSMTRLVSAMEAEGLVVREKNAADGRSVIIRASAEGERILLRGREQRVEALAGWLSALSAERLGSLDTATSTLEDVLRTDRSR